MKTTSPLMIEVEQGMQFQQQGRFAEASAAYQRALALEPQHPELWVNLGVNQMSHGACHAAIKSLKEAVTLRPDFVEAHFNLAIAYKQAQNVTAAIQHYEQALETRPDFYQARLNLANELNDRGDYNQAIPHYQQVLQQAPQHASALDGLGKAFAAIGDTQGAHQCYEQALIHDPSFISARMHLAMVYANEGKIDTALKHLHLAEQQAPENTLVQSNLATVYNLDGQHTEALTRYDRIVAQEPNNAEIHWNRSLLLLGLGRYEEGWSTYHWRRQTRLMSVAYPHTYPQARWEGTSIAGKRLFLHYEQGFGDIFQFLRYLPMVKTRGGTLIVEMPKAVIPLLESWTCIDELIPADAQQKTQIPFDLQVSLLDLPALFGTSLDTIPNNVPYITAPDDKITTWEHRIGQHGFKIGVVWSGTQAGHKRIGTLTQRSMSLSDLAPLGSIPGVRLLGLQKEPRDSLPNDILETNLGTNFQDFADTAAALACMNLVISIDTSVAHLAGAMGCPTWTLLKQDADWRWLQDRTDSPWYPTMRLFRQQKQQGWAPVIHNVTQALRHYLTTWEGL